MKPASTNSTNRRTRGTLGAAVAAAVAASICCVGPIALIGLGASGAWMSRLTALEPIRPLLILATGGLLGYAAAVVYAEPSQPAACEPGSLCADPRTPRINETVLWGVTILVSLLLMVPTIVGLAEESANDTEGPTATATASTATADAAGRERVVLSIDNMTCASCPHNVRKALAAVDGVTVEEVTQDPPRAVVEIDTRRTDVEAVIRATTDVGYPSHRIDP